MMHSDAEGPSGLGVSRISALSDVRVEDCEG